MPDKLFIKTIIPNRIALDFATSEPTHPRPAPALFINSLDTYTKAKLQRLLIICMSAKKLSFQQPCESPLKAQFSAIYLMKSRIDCYYFSQQYKDLFYMTQTPKSNRTSFTMSFFCKTISS